MPLKFEFAPEPDPPLEEYVLSEAAKAPVPVALLSSSLQLIAGIAPQLGEAQLRVLLFLMQRAERASNHTIRASSREIETLARVSRKSVKEALNELALRRYIVIRRGGATSSSIIWVTFLEVRGGVPTTPPPVEIEGTGGVPTTPPQYSQMAKIQRGGGVPTTPPVQNLSLFTRTGAPVESNDKEEQISNREFLFPQETDEAKLLARLAQARPNHFGQRRIDEVRRYIHAYQLRFGRKRNPHPPDDQLCAQFLAIALWPELERIWLQLVKENCAAGSSYGWYIAVFVDRIHGIKMSKVRDVSGRPALVSSQPAATLEALSRPYAPPMPDAEDVGTVPDLAPEPLPALAGLGSSGEVPALLDEAGGLCVKCGTGAASADNSRGHCVACDRAWVESWREAERARHAAPKRKAGW